MAPASRKKAPNLPPSAPQAAYQSHAASQGKDAEAEAFASGDYSRARALGAALLQADAAPADAASRVPLAGPVRQRLRLRQRTLGLDLYVVRVALGSFALYLAAWWYALRQH